MIYKQKEFADLIKVSTRTLTRWDKDGKFPARTNPSGHKFYTEEDLQRYITGEEVILTESEALLILLEMSEDDSENGRIISGEDFKRRLAERRSKVK